MKFTKIMCTLIVAGAFFLLGVSQALAAQYTVKSGDSLYTISKKFGTSVNAIMQANGLKSSTIYPGKILNIPSGGSVSAGEKYIVKSGDSLYKISRRYGTSVDTLIRMNGLKTTTLYPGQVLNVPSGSGVSGAGKYLVRAGDTLYLLSKRWGVSIASIKSVNGLSSNTLYVGQVLQIPGNTASVSVASRGTSSLSRSEVLLLARLINGESRGEPYKGQVAVGGVVLNRIDSPLFPSTLSGVIYQPNEFSVVLDGQINLSPTTTAINAAENALGGWDPSYGALYYWNPAKAPNNKFLNSKTIVARIGNHVFAK